LRVRHDRLPFDEIMTLPDGILVTTPLRTAYDPPMETRIRIAIHAAGLPAPVLQHPIGPYRLDMAYPAIPPAVWSTTAAITSPPNGPCATSSGRPTSARRGREVLRFRAGDVMLRPWLVAATVRRALAR
jgi:hypothetical protein